MARFRFDSRLARSLLLSSVCWLATGLPGTVSSAAASISTPTVPAEVNARLAKEWGLKVIGIRHTAAGYMLDFRYRILDPQKAGKMMDRTIPATLVVEKSGAELKVPRPPTTGRLRGTSKFPKKDRNYFMFFGNPGKHVQPGDKVTVIIGDFRAENITVQ